MVRYAAEEGDVPLLVALFTRTDEESVLGRNDRAALDHSTAGDLIAPGAVVPTMHVLRPNQGVPLGALENGDSSKFEGGYREGHETAIDGQGWALCGLTTRSWMTPGAVCLAGGGGRAEDPVPGGTGKLRHCPYKKGSTREIDVEVGRVLQGTTGSF